MEAVFSIVICFELLCLYYAHNLIHIFLENFKIQRLFAIFYTYFDKYDNIYFSMNLDGKLRPVK